MLDEHLEFLKTHGKEDEVNTYLRVDKEPDKSKFSNHDIDVYDWIKEILATMEAAGDDKWWLGDDIKTLAIRQIYTPLLIMDLADFHNAVTVLLGRPVYSHEIMGRERKEIKKEVERILNGNPLTEDEKIAKHGKVILDFIKPIIDPDNKILV